MSFPITSFRAEIQRKLGFNPFLNEILDDHSDRIALMLPRSFYNSPDHTSFVEYILALLAEKKWRCAATRMDSNVYTNDWLGSRFKTHILGPHILLELEYDETLTPIPIPPLPTIPNHWTIAEISHDSLRNPDSRTATYTYSYEAAFPQDFTLVYDSLKNNLLSNRLENAIV